MKKHQSASAIWPPQSTSVFTAGSSEATNQAFRNNPHLGTHRHSPACIGHVRALLYPLSPEARTSCEAASKAEKEPSPVVRLRMCKESTYFSIGTALSGNVTLTWPEQGPEDDTDYVHQIQVSIYPDPDSDDVELFNASSIITISASCAESEEVHSICPGKHFRLDASYNWSIKITSAHTFGLVLRPTEDILNALIPEHVLRDGYKIFCIPQIRSKKETGQGLGSASKDTVDQDSDLTSRQISLPAISMPSVALPVTDETFEGDTVFHVASPSSSGDDPDPVILFENNGTVVEEISRRGKGRVRKRIRSTCLHTAASQWERETRILGTLSHPHIVKALEWDPHDWSIDFEHGGKDLASLRNATNMFSVAVNLYDVQKRILTHTLSALDHLHNEKNTKHCDFKPHNVLLSDDHQMVKLCDFGHARNMRDVVTSGGTHCYIAPEFLLRGEIGAASDIWALGITMLFVLNIIPLPGTESGAETWQIGKLVGDKLERRKMRRWLVTVKEATERIPASWSALKAMLDFDSEARITAAQLVQKLKTTTILDHADLRQLLEA
jgi:serine/threonine protein kinase